MIWHRSSPMMHRNTFSVPGHPGSCNFIRNSYARIFLLLMKTLSSPSSWEIRIKEHIHFHTFVILLLNFLKTCSMISSSIAFEVETLFFFFELFSQLRISLHAWTKHYGKLSFQSKIFFCGNHISGAVEQSSRIFSNWNAGVLLFFPFIAGFLL